MIVRRKNINKIDNHGFEKSREKSLHDSGPGYQRDGYSSSYSSVHSYPRGSRKGQPPTNL